MLIICDGYNVYDDGNNETYNAVNSDSRANNDSDGNDLGNDNVGVTELYYVNDHNVYNADDIINTNIISIKMSSNVGIDNADIDNVCVNIS